MNSEIKRRGEIILAKLRRSMAKAGVDALVAMLPENFYYASGCLSIYSYINRIAGLAMVLVPRDESLAPVAILNPYERPSFQDLSWIEDAREYQMWLYIDPTHQAGYDPSQEKKVERGTDFGFAESFRMLGEALREKGLDRKKVGIDAGYIQHSSWELLVKNCPDAQFVDAEKVWLDSRVVKTPWEIEYLRIATEVVEKAINVSCKAIHEGATHAEVQHAYNLEAASDPRVIGPHFLHLRMGTKWSPEYLPTGYRLKKGDLIEYDCGVNCMGYISDTARTFSLGKPSDVAKRTHDLTTGGLRKALKLVGPGVRFCDVFEVGHSHVKAQMPHFNRGHIGHSIGLTIAIEEPPFISPTDETRFEPGMVFCVEIPYYGWEVGGISNEQIVVITENGYDLLTQNTLDLVEL